MKTHKKIKKAIITAAGHGTRFLPATKSQQKEMLPIIDKPIIHYLVEECVESGITDIIIVTRKGQHSIEDYFDSNYEFESELEKSGKLDSLQMVKDIPNMANFIYLKQPDHLPYGNATPILVAKELLDDDEAFVYMFGDDMTISKTPVAKQLINVYEKHHPSAILAVQEVPNEDVVKYATVRYKDNPKIKYEVAQLLEKAPLGQNLSNVAQFGRFVFSHDVIDQVLETKTGKGGELWVADVLNALANDNKPVLAQPIEGEWLTTGDPLRYLITTFRYAMLRPDIKDDLIKYIAQKLPGVC